MFLVFAIAICLFFFGIILNIHLEHHQKKQESKEEEDAIEFISEKFSQTVRENHQKLMNNNHQKR